MKNYAVSYDAYSNQNPYEESKISTQNVQSSSIKIFQKSNYNLLNLRADGLLEFLFSFLLTLTLISIGYTYLIKLNQKYINNFYLFCEDINIKIAFSKIIVLNLISL